jgi:hypothetical protein
MASDDIYKIISLEYDSTSNRTLVDMFIKFNANDPYFYNKYSFIKLVH